MNVCITREEPSDYAEVYELNRMAFNRENEAKLVNLLRSSDAFVPELSIVAQLNSTVIGHLLLTKLLIQHSNDSITESLALAPMAVHPDYQNQGVGSKLIVYGIEKAKALNFQSIIVLGHEHYYPKFGFQPAYSWDISPPFEVPKNAFMAIELQTNALKNCSGIVIYPKAFSLV